MAVAAGLDAARLMLRAKAEKALLIRGSFPEPEAQPAFISSRERPLFAYPGLNVSE